MLTDGGGVEGRPESGRRRSSGWLAARGSEQGEARGRLGRAAFIGHEREVPLARTLRWASRGPAAGPAEGRWVGPSGSAQIDRIGFVFFKFIVNIKTIPENLEIVLKARKILRKFQKFQENFQRHFGTRAIQIKHSKLMKNILELSNK
jgi:hypothetical protein